MQKVQQRRRPTKPKSSVKPNRLQILAGIPYDIFKRTEDTWITDINEIQYPIPALLYSREFSESWNGAIGVTATIGFVGIGYDW